MAQNKKSVWSLIILICTIATLAILIGTIVVTAVGLPGLIEQAKELAISEGATADEAGAIAAVVGGVAVAVLVISSIFYFFEILGGFLFSLKGRWGIFCIVIAVLSVVTSIYNLISGISNHAGGATIAIDAIGLAVNLLFGVACVKHLQENRAA